MKGKKKILFALGILVAAAVYYYVTLPAINIHSSDTWVMGLFLLLVLAAAYVVKKRLGRHELKENKVVKCFGILILGIGAVYLIGSVLCDYDAETGEGIIEWLQVLPKYRGRGIASALVCKGLKIMSGFADFATVSGECENVTNPEGVYRKCGFTGNDVWHILRGC